MPEPDWDRIHEIYDEARKLPRAERPAFVEKASAGDASVSRDVLDLLALDDESFMEPPMRIDFVPATDNLLGTTIKERYLIEKELGHGGMSEVYLARDQAVDGRAVVVKFLAGTYWKTLMPGKNSHRNPKHSRAFIMRMLCRCWIREN